MFTIDCIFLKTILTTKFVEFHLSKITAYKTIVSITEEYDYQGFYSYTVLISIINNVLLNALSHIIIPMYVCTIANQFYYQLNGYR